MTQKNQQNKIKCESCRKYKPEYYPNAGICEECAEAIDDHIIKQRDD